jgi:DNA repair protein RadA
LNKEAMIIDLMAHVKSNVMMMEKQDGDETMSKNMDETDSHFEEEGPAFDEEAAKSSDIGTKENFDIADIPGIGKATASKLRSAGYRDAMGIATSSPVGLAEVCEIGEATAKKIIEVARSHLKMDFILGTEMLEKMKSVKQIKTGSKAFDDLIGGGIETQSITECYGQFGSGKSQMAFQLSVNVQLPEEKGGLNGDVVWVDTEGTFRPKRIMQLAEAKGIDAQVVLSKIHVARAFSADHQILLVEKLPELFNKFPNIKLLVVDSITSIFRSEFVGRGTLADRQQKLNKHIHDLQRIADRYNVAVYITNQVMAKPDMFFGDPTAAVGGHVLAHASTYRVYLRHSKGEKRVAKLVDSPCLPEGEAAFQVTAEGIKDIEE